MTADLLSFLRSDDPREVERLCEVVYSRERESFGRIIPEALSGSRQAAHQYVAVWRWMKDSVLEGLHEALPDVVIAVDSRLYIADVTGWPSLGSSVLLDSEALEAPFSKWITRTNDVGTGTCAALIQKVRELTPGLHPVALSTYALPHWEHSEAQIRAFRRHVSAALSESDPPLERIRQVFALNLTQLGAIFGVSRQAVTQWLASGVPDDRLEKVATVSSIADLLEYQLRSDRIPGVVRREAPAYGGLSVLDMIREDRQDELLALTRRSFDWAVPA